jgi:protein phosphatase
MLSFRSAAHSDIGRVRRRNEDRLIRDERAGIFGVADGIGGLPGGAEAAQLAADAMLAGLRDSAPGAEPDMVGLVRKASAAVLDLGRQLSPATGIGTTLTIGCLRGTTLTIGHVGDSRAYALRGKTFSCLTEDHSVENEVKRRRAQGEAVSVSQFNRQALTRCIGQFTVPDVDIWTGQVSPGDRYLFCTDGLTRVVTDEELAGLLDEIRDPQEALNRMVALALERGGPDNITTVLLQIDGT